LKPAPCPVCGHPPKVSHLLNGPRGSTFPLIRCPRCRRAEIAQDAVPGVYGAFLRPWTALQLMGRWNAGKMRRLAPEEAYLHTARGAAYWAAWRRLYPRPWAIRVEDFDRLADDGENIERYIDWRNVRRLGQGHEHKP
jgi:hypothetical protein